MWPSLLRQHLLLQLVGARSRMVMLACAVNNEIVVLMGGSGHPRHTHKRILWFMYLQSRHIIRTQVDHLSHCALFERTVDLASTLSYPLRYNIVRIECLSKVEHCVHILILLWH